MRQVTVDARGQDNRAGLFKVATTILDATIDGEQIGDNYQRRWDGEVDIRAIKTTMQMDVLWCKRPRWYTRRSGPTCWRTTCCGR